MKDKSNKQNFFLKVILPAMVTMILFVAAIFLILIPSFRNAMLMEKKEMIKELSETAWSILNESYELEQKGELSEKEAKARAIYEINGLRYGNDMKDYFWICDMTPKMIVHPYRPELQGKNLSDFTDANNKKVFVEFVNIVKQKEKGYVEYYWQWKDDPQKIVPKLSYVKEFAPWKWIIGTGIYLDDVDKEISKISNRVICIYLQIALVSFLLMFVVIYHSHSIEKERHQSQIELNEAKEKYQLLIESSSEAFILILGGKLNYANSAALKILKCTEVDFLKLKVRDIIDPEHTEDCRKFQKLLDDQVEDAQLETVLIRQDKTSVKAILSISQVLLGNQRGFIVIVNEVSREKSNTRLAQQRKLTEEQKELIADLQNTHRLTGDALPDWTNAAESSSAKELIQLQQGFPTKLKALIDSGINVENLTGITTKMVDAVTRRFIELAIEEVGKPPVPFCFIAYGSQGRREQTLKTDQDNGIIYKDAKNLEDDKDIKAYFLSLGTKVCGWLNEAGYPYCKDDNMAKSKKCVLSLSEWENCFNNWIYNATPDDLLRMNIYFDFRSLYGDATFADNLWKFISETIEERSEFLLHFVEDALLYKPPITLFGNIALRDKGDKRETISLKEVISAIVQFARIYALKFHIHETNTLNRLRALRDATLIKDSTYREASEVYNLLMHLRFKHQAMAMENGEALSNRINPKSLTEIEQEILKKSFAAISNFQTKISFDFKGKMV